MAIASNWPFHAFCLTPWCQIILSQVQLCHDFLLAKIYDGYPHAYKLSNVPHSLIAVYGDYSIVTIHLFILSSICSYSHCVCQAIDYYILNIAFISPPHSHPQSSPFCVYLLFKVFFKCHLCLIGFPTPSDQCDLSFHYVFVSLVTLVIGILSQNSNIF